MNRPRRPLRRAVRRLPHMNEPARQNSLRQKKFALNNRVDQRTQPVVLGLCPREDAPHLATVGIVIFRTRRIHQELTNHIRRKRIRVPHDEILKRVETLKRLAARKLTRGVHRLMKAHLGLKARREMKLRALVAIRERSIPLTKTADDIKAFKSEARRVDLRMTPRAPDI